MRITIASIGRLKNGGERVLVDRYVKRLASARSQGLGPLTEVELPEARQSSAGERQADEAARLLKLVADADLIVALDERGKTIGSTDFARWIGAKRDQGCRHATFLIGGPDGLGEAVVRSATFKLSLGPMTLPHGLARAVLAEQLYRAATILSGHPYHRE